MRFFNTEGPISFEKHYNIPMIERINFDGIMDLIEEKKYFVLHAPRQSGKTSSLLAIMKILNESGKYKCLYVNVEGAQAARQNVEKAMEAILVKLGMNEELYLKENTISVALKKALKTSGFSALESVLTTWTLKSNLPTILLIDEIDSLVGDSLISVLRQLRSGYTGRPKAFPQSVILCGVRDVRDYRIHSSTEKEIITGGSCFNIKAKSLRIRNFTKADVRNLYMQHTLERGQKFDEEAIKLSFRLTNGQPWLVNALAYEVCFEMPEGKNRNNVITENMILDAKENLIRGRVTHLDQLTDKLKETRVRNVIEPILAGITVSEIPQDDLQYVIDLGLIESINGSVEIANQIYKEVIPREIGFMTQTSLGSLFEPMWYVNPDGSLNFEKLLENFQEFFQENSEIWVERFEYKEAGPQLLLQAYLQRVINGGGRIFREYGLGRMRTDILVEWNEKNKSKTKFVLELKILHKTLEKTIETGLSQTWEYMDRTGTDIGHLLIFNRDKNKPWSEKIFRKEQAFNGKKIVIWGM